LEVGFLVVAALVVLATGDFTSFEQLVMVKHAIPQTKKGRIIFFIACNLASKFTKYFSIFHCSYTLNFERAFARNVC
jgi:hypothetical protein